MNLVHERIDRIMVLEKVGSILANHPPLMGINCNCEICQQATEVGRVARYSPRVSRILAKGEDMTTSEYQYLLGRGLTRKEIEQEAGVTLERFASAKVKEPLTVSRYEMLREKGLMDKEIGPMHGMTPSMMLTWKRKNGFIKIEIKGLNENSYKKMKAQGLTDKNIAKKLNTSINMLNAWKHQNFTEDQIKAMNQKSGRYQRSEGA